jgi:hypothetical protein
MAISPEGFQDPSRHGQENDSPPMILLSTVDSRTESYMARRGVKVFTDTRVLNCV